MKTTAMTDSKKTSMTLGILEAGLVNETLKPEYGSYPDMFRTLLSEQDPTIKFKFYNVLEGEYPADINECDAYLITGSKHNSYDEDPWIVVLKDYIRTLLEQDKKLLGICFGHQLIAHALGGLAAKSDRGWGVGIYNSQITPNLDLPWLKDYSTQFKLLVSHQDQVIILPKGATLFASNPFCPNAAYFIQDKVLCFQGHPEFTTDYAKELMQSRKSDIGEEAFSQAMSSFANAADHQNVARWMLDFVGAKK
jgi:GMP synthase-like glutamine amidotransferase